MSQLIPWLLLVSAAFFLLASLYAIWRSLTAALGAGSVSPGAIDLQGSERRRALLLEKEALLRNLKDLEFERDADKIGSEDFARIERKLRARAKEVLMLLDEEAAPFRAEAERLISEHVGEQAHGSREPSREPERPLTCPTCEAANDSDAAFCKKCGAKLQGSANEEQTR